VLPASTLLTASSVVILPTLILKPKWVQYPKEHRKVDVRELTVVHLAGARISQGHASLRGVHLTGVHLMNVPLSWTSLAGLSRRHASVSAPKAVSSASASEPVSSAFAPEPMSSASAQEPVSPTSRPRASAPCPAPVPTPEPRRSKRTLSTPGHYLDSTLGWLSRVKLYR